MRITKIALKNFRAFYAEHEIDLGKKGRNLLIYGENGSGKSSLLKAIELFIDSHVRNIDFDKHRNFFVSSSEGGYVKIFMRSAPNAPETTYEWSATTRETNDPIILDASKTKGSLDYKALLEVYFLHPKDREINLFDFLVTNLLSNSINTNNPIGPRFGEEWVDIQQNVPRSAGHTRKIENFEKTLDYFNQGLSSTLNQLKIEASDILQGFNYPVTLDFSFSGVTLTPDKKSIQGNEIVLRIDCQAIQFHLAHQFLNEAKLSAIALSVYLAALRVNPSSALKVLVLDDVLIGLDMSNRLPVIDILKRKFDDYQIFLMTYDKEWYEIVKRNFPSWKTIELYAGHGSDYEMPILVENKNYLDKAKFYLQVNDHKAAAIYLRTAFEVKIKWFCEKKNIPIKYREKPKDLATNDFWEPIKNTKQPDNTPMYVSDALAFDVELYRSFIMNPLSHAHLAIAPRQEIQDAIDTVERLEQALDAIVNPPTP